MTPDDHAALAALDATAQAELFRRGDLSAREAVQAAIERAEAVDGVLHSIIHPRYEEALADADRLDARRGEDPSNPAPFAGVPMVVKDLDGTDAGQPYHGGTRFLQRHGYVASADSELNARFRRAGLISIGRTNTPELGLVTTTEPDAVGPTHNPWDPERSTGGSSGGSAAAVAAGIVAIGHAGDGGGSIRIPAGECGLVGLKPSRGRVPVGPEIGEAWGGLVARLAVTRSVRDTAALLDAVAGPGVGDPYTAGPPARPYRDEVGVEPRRLRVGLVVDHPDGSTVTDPEVALVTRSAADLLGRLGHHVDDTGPAALGDPAIPGHFLVALASWVARELDRMAILVGEPVTEGDVEPGTWATALAGRSVTAADYLAAIDGLHAYTRTMVAWWEGGYDLLLTPTIPELPPLLGEFTSTVENPHVGAFRSTPLVSFTLPFNVSGQPAISLPLGLSASGLPIGVQLVAAPGREDLLIQVASQLEQCAPWEDRRPRVWAGTA